MPSLASHCAVVGGCLNVLDVSSCIGAAFAAAAEHARTADAPASASTRFLRKALPPGLTMTERADSISYAWPMRRDRPNSQWIAATAAICGSLSTAHAGYVLPQAISRRSISWL